MDSGVKPIFHHLFFQGPWDPGLKSKTTMEVKIEQIEKLMRKAFETGKKTHQCDYETMELWIKDEINTEFGMYGKPVLERKNRKRI